MFTKQQVKSGHNSRRNNYHEDFVEVIQPFDEADTDESSRRSLPPQRSGYMAELEQWIDEALFEPIRSAIAEEDAKGLSIAFNEATGQIKRRVLASYHNGLKARSNAR